MPAIEMKLPDMPFPEHERALVWSYMCAIPIASSDLLLRIT